MTAYDWFALGGVCGGMFVGLGMTLTQARWPHIFCPHDGCDPFQRRR